MKVLIVGPYAEDGQVSIPAFACTLVDGCRAAGIAADLVSPTATGLIKKLTSVHRKFKFIDKFVVFPMQLRKIAKGYDVVHLSEHGYSPYVKAVGATPTVVTCHDLIVAKAAFGEIPGWPVGKSGKAYQEAIIRGLERATAVAAVSEYTLTDVLRLSKCKKERLRLIYNGFYRRHYAAAAPTQPAAGPFFLHVGGNSPSKNKLGVIQIFQELQKREATKHFRLVLAGAKPPSNVLDAIAQLPQPEKVVIMASPTDETIAELYRTAEALIFPSLLEGFGLPIIEAQSYGCLVFTSNRPPLTEVGGDAAVYIDPLEPAAAAEIIENNLPLKAGFIGKGEENIKRFTTEEMVAKYLTLYKEVA